MLVNSYGFNNPYKSYDNNRIAFKSNQGFLNEIEVFKKGLANKTPSTESVGRLQLHSQTVNMTDEFLKQVETAAGSNKDLHTFLKKILGLIPWK